MKKKNAIIGLVKNYDTAQLQPFVSTIKSVGFDGDIILFTAAISDKTLAYLKRNGIKTIPFDKRFPYLEGLSSDALSRQLPAPMDICSIRFVLYYLFLKQHSEEYGHLMLTDVRDVVFQRDPFTFDCSGVCFFEEDVDIAESKVNRQWIKKIYGSSTVEKLAHKKILCAGTILGDYANIMCYLEKMMDALLTTDGDRGDDQAIHMHIGYFDEMLPVTRFPNRTGPILTVGNGNQVPQLDKNGIAYNERGEEYCVVHQFDRIPALERKYSPFSARIKKNIRASAASMLLHFPTMFKFLKKQRGW